MGQSAAQKANAKRLAAQRRVKKAAAEVKKAREAAQDLDVTSVAGWKKSSGANERGPVKLKLPSGNVCVARNPGMEAFLEQGMIPNGLMPIIMDAIKTGKGMNADAVEDIVADQEMLSSVVELANAVVVHCVVEPPVHAVPEDEADRDEDLLYADEIVLGDRMFLMQWVVGGTSDLERFREEQAVALGLVDEEQGVGEASE